MAVQRGDICRGILTLLHELPRRHLLFLERPELHNLPPWVLLGLWRVELHEALHCLLSDV